MVLVGRDVAAHVKDGVVGAEPGQGVDVGVGVVAGQIAVMKPEDAPQAEQLAQRGLDAGLVEMGIAVAVEQALGGGEQRPLAVALDPPPFEDQADGVQGQGAEGAGLVQAAADLVVMVAGELEPPAVEAEIEQSQPLLVLDGDGAEIPGPGIVCGNGVDAHPLQIGAGGAQLGPYRLRLGGDQEHPLVSADLGDDVAEHRLDLVEAILPVAVGVGPGEQDAVLLFPLGGESS